MARSPSELLSYQNSTLSQQLVHTFYEFLGNPVLFICAKQQEGSERAQDNSMAISIWFSTPFSCGSSNITKFYLCLVFFISLLGVESVKGETFKIVNSLSRNWLKSSSVKPKVIQSTPPTGAQRETFIGKKWKQSKAMIWLAMAGALPYLGKPSWLLWLVVLTLWLLNFEAFQA